MEFWLVKVCCLAQGHRKGYTGYCEMKIAVVGTGYVGLVSGTCFAESGNDVVCIDIDKNKVEHMKQGRIPIYEPGLEEIFKKNIEDKKLSFSTDLATSIKDVEVIFLALPTPPGENGSADLSYILGVANDIGTFLQDYKVIVNKSTVPVGTAEKVQDAVAKSYTGEFDVVSNPEFLKEGFAVSDFMKPDRVVIGTESAKARDIMDRLYKPFVENDSQILHMDQRSSEMTKYAANAFLATKISFMNEIANLSERVGADVDAIRRGIGSDPRIGEKFLYPGIGYGGSCFPKDVLALHETARENDYNFQILEAVTNVNNAQKKTIVTKIKKYYGDDLTNKTFALWGLAFKPDTDDIREAPALDIINELTTAGAHIQAFDPEAMENVAKLHVKNLRLVDNKYDALESANALIIATEWNDFKKPDFAILDSRLKEKVVFDGRNLYSHQDLENRNYHYESVGRGYKNV